MLRCLCAGTMGPVHVLCVGGCRQDPPSKTSHGDYRVCGNNGDRPHAPLASPSRKFLPVELVWAFTEALGLSRDGLRGFVNELFTLHPDLGPLDSLDSSLGIDPECVPHGRLVRPLHNRE